MKPLIIANWKMNPSSFKKAEFLFEGVKLRAKDIKKVKVVICPPFPYISGLSLSKTKDIFLGAQDVFWEKEGAFTGEVSPLMLKSLKCSYVILGHSERRSLGEKDEEINKKIKAALSVNLIPVLCIGETSFERQNKKTFKKIASQLTLNLTSISKELVKKVIIAYEPIWAIGTGKACSPKEAREVREYIEKIVRELYPKVDLTLVYGGSVNPRNVLSYFKEAGYQGVLVGGASLKLNEFSKILQFLKNYASGV